MILEFFDSVSAEELLGWYDLSLLQTLLFTCTRLEFSVKGGVNWKNILRKVKRLGLMYNLREQVTPSENADTENVYVGKGREHLYHVSTKNNSGSDSKLVCPIDGPVSLFKLTERYGTSIAKLIPVIISSSWWYLSASIVRKTMSGKKIYEFKTSSSGLQQHNLREPSCNYKYKNNNHSTNNNSNNNNSNSRLTSSYFDSSVEEKFAVRFEHLANRWKIKREPDPLIVGNGVAFIPDFLFEKYGRKVYLEIVGFWTKDTSKKNSKKLAIFFITVT